MKLTKLAESIGAKFVTAGDAESIEIDRVYAGDRVSDLLNQVSDTTLLVTNLTNSGIARLVELMDAPAVCLLNGVSPEDALQEVAEEHRASILVSPHGMFETCGRLYAALGGLKEGSAGR